MSEGISGLSGAGDLCLHTRECCADSEMMLPLGYYEGIDLTVDLERLRGSEPEILREAGMDAAFLSAAKLPAKVPDDAAGLRWWSRFLRRSTRFRSSCAHPIIS